MIRPAGKAARGPSELAETALRSAVLIPGLESITTGFPAWAVLGKLEDFLPEFPDTSPVPHPPNTSASSLFATHWQDITFPLATVILTGTGILDPTAWFFRYK